MFNHAWGNCYPSKPGIPAAHQKFLWTHVQKDIRATVARAHAKSPPLGFHPHARHRDMFMRQDCCARTPHAHLDLSPCAKRHVTGKKQLRSHASRSVRKQKCLCDNTAEFSRRVQTWISLCARRDMFRQKTAAFSCREHTGISLRVQTNMFMRQHC